MLIIGHSKCIKPTEANSPGNRARQYWLCECCVFYRHSTALLVDFARFFRYRTVMSFNFSAPGLYQRKGSSPLNEMLALFRHDIYYSHPRIEGFSERLLTQCMTRMKMILDGRVAIQETQIMIWEGAGKNRRAIVEHITISQRLFFISSSEQYICFLIILIISVLEAAGLKWNGCVYNSVVAANYWNCQSK